MSGGWDSYFGAGPGSSAPAGNSAPADWDTYLAQGAPAAAPAPAAPSAGIAWSAPAWTRTPLMLAGGAISGLEGDIRAVGAGAANLGSPLLNPTGQVALSGEVPKAGVTSGSPNLASQLGLPQPTTPTQRLEYEAAAGAAGALPFVPTAAGLLPALVAGAVGSTAGEAARSAGAGNTGAGVAGTLAGLVPALLLPPPESLGQLASKIGTSTTLEQAGTRLQNDARQWLQDTFKGTAGSPSTVDKIWAPVDAGMAGAPTPLANYASALGQINSAGGKYSASNKAMSWKLPGQLATDLQNQGLDASWEEASQLRSRLGNLKANPSQDPGMDAAQLDQLYGALTSDMERSAQFAGMGDQFRQANADTSSLYDVRRGVMSKIVRDDSGSSLDPLPGNVAQRMMTEGRNQGTTLQTLRSVLPGATDELVSAHLQQPKGGQVWNALSPEAQAAAVPDPAQRTAINNAVPEKPGSGTSHALQSLIAEAAIRGIGAIAASLTGHNPVLGEAVGGPIGLAVPPLVRGVVNRATSIGTNPQKALLPLIGGSMGAVQGR